MFVKLQEYAKTVVAIVGGLGSFSIAAFIPDPEVQKWILLGWAAVVSFSVYQVPNKKPEAIEGE